MSSFPSEQYWSDRQLQQFDDAFDAECRRLSEIDAMVTFDKLVFTSAQIEKIDNALRRASKEDVLTVWTILNDVRLTEVRNRLKTHPGATNDHQDS